MVKDQDLEKITEDEFLKYLLQASIKFAQQPDGESKVLAIKTIMEELDAYRHINCGIHYYFNRKTQSYSYQVYLKEGIGFHVNIKGDLNGNK